LSLEVIVWLLKTPTLSRLCNCLQGRMASYWLKLTTMPSIGFRLWWRKHLRN